MITSSKEGKDKVIAKVNKTKTDKAKTINEMTRADFDAVPPRTPFNQPLQCAAIVILPSRRVHESGYRVMDFVAVDLNNKPMCRLSGCSDVLHVDGIGGYGYEWMKIYGTVPTAIPPSGWSIDCLPISGLLRMWAKGTIHCDPALSSFCIYALPR